MPWCWCSGHTHTHTLHPGPSSIVSLPNPSIRLVHVLAPFNFWDTVNVRQINCPDAIFHSTVFILLQEQIWLKETRRSCALKLQTFVKTEVNLKCTDLPSWQKGLFLCSDRAALWEQLHFTAPQLPFNTKTQRSLSFHVFVFTEKKTSKCLLRGQRQAGCDVLFPTAANWVRATCPVLIFHTAWRNLWWLRR